MIHWQRWKEQQHPEEHRWLVVGKGPTSELFSELDTTDYQICALNHVGRQVPCAVCHVIDIDVLKACGEDIVRNARWLVMPRRPHLHSRPSRLRLEHFFDALPCLSRANSEGRLVWYDLDSSPLTGVPPALHAGAFSVETAFELLARCGVRHIATLGIDGGRSYGGPFLDLAESTLLSNGQASFNAQFQGIDQICRQYGVVHMPIAEVMRVFVGCDDSQVIPARVLEYSIRKHTQSPVEVFLMRNMPFRQPRDQKNKAGTAFSFNRFLIPQLSGYRGRALYLDADMLVFSDIQELWDLPWDGKEVLCTDQQRVPEEWLGGATHFRRGRQMSVMLLNCDTLSWDVGNIIAGLDKGLYSYSQLMDDMCVVPSERIASSIPPEWNCLEWFESGKTKLIHYTVVPTQPWKRAGNTNEAIWLDSFRAACRDGAIEIEEVMGAVRGGFCRQLLIEIAEQERQSRERNSEPPKNSGLTHAAVDGQDNEATRLRESLWGALEALHKSQCRLAELETPYLQRIFAACTAVGRRYVGAAVRRFLGRF